VTAGAASIAWPCGSAGPGSPATGVEPSFALPPRPPTQAPLGRGGRRREHPQRCSEGRGVTARLDAHDPNIKAVQLAALGINLLVAGPWSAMPGTGTGWWGGHQRNMAGHMGWNRTASAPAEPPVAGAPEVLIDAGDLWFEPARVEVEAGSTVNLVLDNTGQVFHDLSIPELDILLRGWGR
jgi:hypothetical protein